MRCLLGRTLLLALCALPAFASDSSECDRLAAEPGSLVDQPGVAYEAIDAELAIAACGAAVEADPSDPRLSHQFARALERSGRIEDARQFYGWAAGDGYGPAQAALDRLDALAATQDGRSEAAARAADTLAALSSTLRRYLNSLPPDPGDPLTILSRVGPDPDALTAWVAGNTRLVGYRGSLRGARGVLLDRAGNSLDRSLLLAALLRGAGNEVRLVRAEIDDAQARGLVESTQRTIDVPRLANLSREEMIALFSDPRFDRATIERIADEVVSDNTAAQALAEQRFGSIYPALREALGGAVTGQDGAGPGALDALRDHFWVQMRVADAWRDLDPEAGSLGNLEPQEKFDAADAPADLRYRVDFRLVLELQDDAGLREETLLSWGADTASLVGQPIEISHIPGSVGAIEQTLRQSDFAQRLLDTLDQEASWFPVLQTGRESMLDRRFTRDGRVAAAPLTWLSDTGAAIAALPSAVAMSLVRILRPRPRNPSRRPSGSRSSCRHQAPRR